MSIGAIMAMTEARRRRDKRGRYMEGDDGPEMNIRGEAESRYYPGGFPPYGEGNEMNENEMRRRGETRMREEKPLNGVDTQHRPYTHHSEHDPFPAEEPGKSGGNTSRMGGEGYVTWNRMDGVENAWNGGNTNFYPPTYPMGTMRGGNITSMHDYEHHKNSPEAHRKIGYQQDEEDDEPMRMNREQAEQWVSKMKHIQIRMPYDEVKRRAVNYGIEQDKIPEFYAAFNMIQSDYGTVAKEFGVSTPDFYAAMAKAWIMDEDAVEGKTALYEKCIVKK